MDDRNTLISTVPGPNITSSYIFRSYGDGWSLQQKLTAFNWSDPALLDGSEPAIYKPDPSSAPTGQTQNSMRTQFSNPRLQGGNLLYSAGQQGGVQIRSQFRNGSCLLLWMSDHFLDGWDTAVLTVRAPDLSNDTFHPHCDEVGISSCAFETCSSPCTYHRFNCNYFA